MDAAGRRILPTIGRGRVERIEKYGNGRKDAVLVQAFAGNGRGYANAEFVEGVVARNRRQGHTGLSADDKQERQWQGEAARIRLGVPLDIVWSSTVTKVHGGRKLTCLAGGSPPRVGFRILPCLS